MARKLLKEGDRIRMRRRLMSGWKGTGTVTYDMSPKSPVVTFAKDDAPEVLTCSACRWEVSLISTPRPTRKRAKRKS